MNEKNRYRKSLIHSISGKSILDVLFLFSVSLSFSLLLFTRFSSLWLALVWSVGWRGHDKRRAITLSRPLALSVLSLPTSRHPLLFQLCAIITRVYLHHILHYTRWHLSLPRNCWPPRVLARIKTRIGMLIVRFKSATRSYRVYQVHETLSYKKKKEKKNNMFFYFYFYSNDQSP